VFGTAATYTAVGVTAGATGDQLQAYFQNPWGIDIVVAILVFMSLSMFGLYDIQIPASMQSKLQTQTGRHKGGALGSGVILIGLGYGASCLLPKAGPWMENVKYVFGVLLLGVAIHMLGALPDLPVLYLWAMLLIVVSIYLGALESLPSGTAGWRDLSKGLGVFVLIWGVLALLGGMTNNRDITRPIDLSTTGLFASAGLRSDLNKDESHIVFTRVSATEEPDKHLSTARTNGRPVMLDYYADWCIDCIRMEKSTFGNQAVVSELSDFVMLQVDVTDPRNPITNAIKKRYGVYGPPAMLFFDTSGNERNELRRYGYMGPEEFLNHVRKI
jgi:thiol:disulfide interchange protein DsbD